MRPRRHDRAPQCGPSTSPLEAMTGRVLLAVTAAVLFGVVAWTLIPPFPPPSTLIDQSPQALAMQLGAPHEIASPVPAPQRPWRTIAWEKSRGIATWEVQAEWGSAPDDPLSPPDMVWRCLRVTWASVLAAVPLRCETVMRGRVMTSNNRWRGP